MKKVAEEFKKEFPCLGENVVKYIAFTIPIEKEVTIIDEMRKKLQKCILHI